MKAFMTASEICELTGCSMGHAYHLIERCNNELKAAGKMTIRGRVNRRYFFERFGLEEEPLNPAS